MNDVAAGAKPGLVLLSDLLGRAVVDRTGTSIGRVRDLAATASTSHPTVTGLVVGASGGSTRLLPWPAVGAVAPSGPLQLRGGFAPTSRPAPERDLPLEGDELLLARDVVDTQVVDLQDYRLSRVSDLYLASQANGAMEVAAAEVGLAAVLRRMGLGWLGRRLRPVVVDWTDLHLTSRRGHEIQLAASTAAFHGLDSHGLAELLTRLSTEHATELIRSLPPSHAAAAIHRSHPATGQRLVRALGEDDATLLVAAARPAHAARLAELQAHRTAPARRRLLRTAGWRRYRPLHESQVRGDGRGTDR